jgi:Chaperone of endosialidase
MSTLLNRLNTGTSFNSTISYDEVDVIFVSQNTTGEYANSAFLHANSSYSHANSSYSHANTADQRAITSGSYANSAYAQANTSNQRAVTSGVYANSAYAQANTATTNAATADQRAVTSGVYANAAFTKANASLQSISGTSGLIFANTSGNTVTLNLSTTSVIAGSYGTPTTYPVVTVDSYGRISGITTQTVTTTTNQATFGVTYSYDKFNGNGSTLSFNLSRAISAANTVQVFVNGVVQEYGTVWDATGAQLTFTTGSAPPVGANNVVVQYLIQPGAVALIDTTTDTSNTNSGRAATPLAVNTVFSAVQSAGNFANAAFSRANTADQRAVTSGDYANSAFSFANTSNQRAVTSGSYANSAYAQANTATTNAATADQRAVTSGVYANSAFASANTKFNSTGGTISGAVNISSGGLTVTGAITATGDIGAYVTSDIRLKENINIIENALEKIDNINGVYYNWTDEAIQLFPEKNKDVEVGVIAQEIQEILPEVVTLRDNGYYAVKYERIIALLIQSVKELKKQVNELKDKNATNHS